MYMCHLFIFYNYCSYINIILDYFLSKSVRKKKIKFEYIFCVKKNVSPTCTMLVLNAVLSVGHLEDI